MKYEVHLVKTAASYLRRLDKPTQQRIAQRIDELSEDPFAYSKPLKGTDLRSSRVGHFRILLEAHQDQLFILVLGIGPRGQIYRQV